MDNKYVDSYFTACFFTTAGFIAPLVLVTALFGLILISILLMPLFVAASVTDTFQMIGKGIDKVFKR